MKKLLTLCSVFGFLLTLNAQKIHDHEVFEPSLPRLQQSVKNIFLKAKVTASGALKGFEPSLAIDGKLNNPNQHWGCENLPVSLLLELDQAQKLSQIQIFPYWGDGRVYKYTIEGSVDGQAFFMLADASANSITSSALGVKHAFDPQEIKFVRVTILDNSRGKVNGGHIVEIQGFADAQSGHLIGGAARPFERYTKDDSIASLNSKTVEVDAWENERVNLQFVVQSPNDGKFLRIYPVQKSTPKAPDLDLNFVRYVQAAGTLQADILQNLKIVKSEPNANRPIWGSINVGHAPAGSYTYTFMVGESMERSLSFEVKLNVLPYVLPDPKDWKIHLDLWQTPESVARVHQVEPWSDAHWALLKPHMKRLADAGQKCITTTIIYEAWDRQSYDDLPGMIKWTKSVDGTMRYDYSIFDKWVAFMTNEIGIKGPISCYTMVPWSLSFRYFDEAKGEDVDLKLTPNSKAYEDYWGPFLTDFRNHLKEKNWLERTRIAMDERPDHLMLPAIAIVKKYAPELHIASAVDRATEKTKDIFDLSPAISQVDASIKWVPERKKNGYLTTFYVCCNPPSPNTFTKSRPVESTWLPLFASAHELDGFLRWTFDNFVENPLKCTDYTKWSSGDCFFVYPGNRSSLRFESFRDGVEMFEQIELLREKVKNNPSEKNQLAIEKLNRHLSETYTWKRGQRADNPFAQDVLNTKTEINNAAKVIY